MKESYKLFGKEIGMSDIVKIVNHYHTYSIWEYVSQNFDLYKDDVSKKEYNKDYKLSPEEVENFCHSLYVYIDDKYDRVHVDYEDLLEFCKNNGYVLKDKEMELSNTSDLKSKNSGFIENPDNKYRDNEFITHTMVDLLENEGFSVYQSYNGDPKEKEVCIEIGQGSPLGQDWHEAVIFNVEKNRKNNDKEFASELERISDGFDVDEEAEIFVKCRGENGTPNSIKDLVEDAEWKKEKLQELSKEVNKLIENRNENIKGR